MKMKLETKIQRTEMAKRRHVFIFVILVLIFLAAKTVSHFCPLEALTVNMDPETVGIIAISFNAFWIAKASGIMAMVLLVMIGFIFWDLRILRNKKETQNLE